MRTGRIHSIESFGTLDGPGVRTVVFLQGCPNKCKYCHNVDCAVKKGGKEYTPEQLVKEVLRNKEYWDDYSQEKEGMKGGVTFSGGEPVYQSDFLLKCIKLLKKENVHVVVDSSLKTDFENVKKLSDLVDLWMISIKHMDNETHISLVGTENRDILENIQMLDKQITEKDKKQQIRIRFVVIPTLTDSKEHIVELGKFIQKIKNLEKVELLPYSTIGRHKWIELFGKYELDGIPDATDDDVKIVKETLIKFVSKF